MTNKILSGVKRYRESVEPESCQMAKSFPFRWASSKLYVILSWQFSAMSIAWPHCLFTTWKFHKVL